MDATKGMTFKCRGCGSTGMFVQRDDAEKCDGMECDTPFCYAGMAWLPDETYKSSAQQAYEIHEKVLEAIELAAPKGKQDFTGAVDGGGYKGSMDSPAKPPVTLIPPTIIKGVARVLQFGAKKYARGNWMRGMSFSEVLDGINRHLLAIQSGEDVDPESGELHLYHAACGLSFLSWFVDGPHKDKYTVFDDRLFKET